MNGTVRFQRVALVRWLVWVTASYAIAVSHVQFFTYDNLAAFTDSQAYIGVAQGHYIATPFAFRVGVPWLAALVPDGLVGMLSGRTDLPAWTWSAKFAVINVLLLSLSGAAFHAWLRDLEFPALEAMAGTLLFYTARSTLQSGGMPTVEPAAWLCFILAALLIRRGATLWLFALMVVGMFFKETLLLLVPLALLSDHPRRTRWRQTAILMLGAAPYFVVRFVLARHAEETASSGCCAATYSSSTVHDGLINLLHPSLPMHTALRLVTSPERLLELYSAYGLLWIPASWALWARVPIALPRRWWWLVVLLILMIVVMSLDVGRILFLSFPIVLPYALTGTLAWLRAAPRSNGT